MSQNAVHVLHMVTQALIETLTSCSWFHCCAEMVGGGRGEELVGGGGEKMVGIRGEEGSLEKRPSPGDSARHFKDDLRVLEFTYVMDNSGEGDAV